MDDYFGSGYLKYHPLEHRHPHLQLNAGLCPYQPKRVEMESV